MKHSLAATLHFANKNIFIEGDSTGGISSYGPVLHSYIWMPYKPILLLKQKLQIGSHV
jgi:hypothetical protein